MNIFERIKKSIEAKQKDKERIYYLKLIDEAKERISRGRSGFDEARSETLTEYFIYERIAAELHFQYLMKIYTEKHFNIAEPQILEASESEHAL